MNDLMQRYFPMIAAIFAAALFVATVPSRPVDDVALSPTGSDFELPEVVGSGQSPDQAAAGSSTGASAVAPMVSAGPGTDAAPDPGGASTATAAGGTTSSASSGSTASTANSSSNRPVSSTTPGSSSSSSAGGSSAPPAPPSTTATPASAPAPAADPGPTTTAAASSEPDCFRQQSEIGSPACRPAWDGTGNSGASAPGVTAADINIVFYEPKRNAQVAALLSAAGTASPEEVQEVLSRYEVYFNTYYETYGRHVNLIYQEGPGGGADAAEDQADAATIATELNAFYASCSGCASSWHDELTRRGVPNTTVITPFRQEYLEESAPYLYSVLPDFDLTAQSAAEYYCQRVSGGNAEHAGDATLQLQSRSLGIIAMDTPDDPGGEFARLVEACGGEVAGVARYASGITTAQQQSTNAVVQMRQAGATTITCVCDVIAPVFLTGAATQQGYFPEWFSNGLFALDSYKAAQLYDQNQWEHAFGIASIPRPEPMEEEEWVIAYTLGGGEDMDALQNAGSSIFSGLVQAVDAIEFAGPTLTIDSFTNAMLTLPAYQEDRPGGPRQSFGNNGPGPWSRLDDHAEVWWDPDRTGPNGRPGNYFYVESGRRYLLGEWPTTAPNVFVDDGSTQ